MNRRNLSFSLLFLLTAEIAFSGTGLRQFSRAVDFTGNRVKVKTANGSIIVDAYSERNVTIEADIRVRAASRAAADRYLQQVDITIEKIGSDLLVGVEAPPLRPMRFIERLLGGGAEVKVDFYIKLPKDKSIQAETVNGSVDIVDVVHDVVMRTVNGNLTAKGCGAPVRAETTNGHIHLEMADMPSTAGVRLNTVNGSIALVLPKTAAAELNVSTVNGRIKTALPVEVIDGWGGGKLRGRIKSGGPLVQAETINGSVTIDSR